MYKFDVKNTNSEKTLSFNSFDFKTFWVNKALLNDKKIKNSERKINPIDNHNESIKSLDHKNVKNSLDFKKASNDFVVFSSQTNSLKKGRVTKNSGRNNQGRISIRHRGGGHKSLYRASELRETQGLVIQSDFYNPFSSSHYNVVITRESINSKKNKRSKLFLELNTSNVSEGSFLKGFPKNPNNKGPRKDLIMFGEFNHHRVVKIDNGVRCPLYIMPVNSQICLLEIRPGQGPKMIKAAGTYGTLIRLEPFKVDGNPAPNEYRKGIAWVELPSKEIVELPWNVLATLGSISQGIGSKNQESSLYKAGQNRWRGKRPTVRGVAMNPVDHPMGGGEKATKGGRPSVSPWGKLAKGKPTRKPKLSRSMKRIKLARFARRKINL